MTAGKEAVRGAMAVRILVIGLALASLWTGGARAATTVYPVSVFNTVAVTSGGTLIGNTPASANFIRGSSIGLNYGVDISKFTLNVEVASASPGTAYLTIRFGRYSGVAFTGALGVGLLTPGGAPTQVIFTPVARPGTYWINSMAYEAGCAAIGGCNAVVIGNSILSPPLADFRVAVVGATPEPSQWALMILGFAGVAARLKAARKTPCRAY